jgi:hypothetical protein
VVFADFSLPCPWAEDMDSTDFALKENRDPIDTHDLDSVSRKIGFCIEFLDRPWTKSGGFVP